MNYFITTVITIILISKDILLFNEETLILFCFIGFCLLFIENINSLVTVYFQNQSNTIYNEINLSYKTLLEELKAEFQWVCNKKKLKLYFFKTKQYYFNLNIKVIEKLSTLQIVNKQLKVHQKLIFAQELEQQFKKLIVLLLLVKLKKLIKLNLFYTNIIQISHFKQINKLILREYLENLT
jgi:hypothetical protein